MFTLELLCFCCCCCLGNWKSRSNETVIVLSLHTNTHTLTQKDVIDWKPPNYYSWTQCTNETPVLLVVTKHRRLNSVRQWNHRVFTAIRTWPQSPQLHVPLLLVGHKTVLRQFAVCWAEDICCVLFVFLLRETLSWVWQKRFIASLCGMLDAQNPHGIDNWNLRALLAL